MLEALGRCGSEGRERGKERRPREGQKRREPLTPTFKSRDKLQVVSHPEVNRNAIS